MASESAKVKGLETRVQELEAEVAMLRDALKGSPKPISTPKPTVWAGGDPTLTDPNFDERPDVGAWRPWFAADPVDGRGLPPIPFAADPVDGRGLPPSQRDRVLGVSNAEPINRCNAGAFGAVGDPPIATCGGQRSFAAVADPVRPGVWSVTVARTERFGSDPVSDPQHFDSWKVSNTPCPSTSKLRMAVVRDEPLP